MTSRNTATRPSRRRFLSGMGATALAGVAGGYLMPSTLDRLRGLDAGQDVTYQTRAGLVDSGLILVAIQLEGGLDFMDAVVPTGDPLYRALRGSSALSGDVLTPIDDDYSFASMPYLASQWQANDLAVVHGVGHPDASLSHFDATDMWEKASLDFGTRTGWLGRALDQFAVDADPLIGVSMEYLSPSLYAPNWTPFALPVYDTLPWTADYEADNPALVQALGDLSSGATRSGTLADDVRRSQALVQQVGRRLDPVLTSRAEDFDEDQAGDESNLSLQLSMVADLINADMPTRAFHTTHSGFDTHATQTEDLPNLLAVLDSALEGFHQRLGANRDRVVVMTWTEFGRRPEWNGSGTDHGTAGTQFVIGPRANGGHHGEPVSLSSFDEDGNFLVTTDFRDYLGGMVQSTFGVDAASIVDGATSPLVVLS